MIPEVTRIWNLIRPEECPDRERFLTLGSQVSLSVHAGRGAVASPPGSLGEAANGGRGQAGLRLRVPNEPGGIPRHQVRNHSRSAGRENVIGS